MRDRLFLLLVGVLPLHTVFVSGWISWKPLLVVLVVVVASDVVVALRSRSWPWPPPASLALMMFLGGALVSIPDWPVPARFVKLWLALGVGGLLMLVTARSLRNPGMLARVAKTIAWSGALMAACALLFSLWIVGSPDRIESVNQIPGVFRVAKPAYLEQGFLALTNWHQDPGYAAAWMNLWASLWLLFGLLGLGTGRNRLDALGPGVLMVGSVMTASRTGLLTLVIDLAVVAWVGARLVKWKSVVRQLSTAAAAAVLALGLIGLADRQGIGGDLDREFGFRLSNLFNLGRVAPTEGEVGTGDPSDNRLEVWGDYLAEFRQHPWRGIGLGTGWDQLLQEPHNLGVEVLSETGLVGALSLIGLVLVVLRTGGGAAGGIALLVSLLPGLAQTVLFEPTWWFAAGLFLGGAGLPLGATRDPVNPAPQEAHGEPS